METLRDKTIAYIKAHPDAPTREVAQKCGVHRSYVQKIKQNLKKLPSPQANGVRGQKRDAVITYIQEHPAATIAEMAKGTGVSRTFIKDISKRLNEPKAGPTTTGSASNGLQQMLEQRRDQLRQEMEAIDNLLKLIG